MIIDRDHLKFLPARGGVEHDALSRPRVHERSGQGRKPAHPTAFRVGFIHTDNPVSGFAMAIANKHRRTKSHDIRFVLWRRYHDGGTQAFLQVAQPLVEDLQALFRVFVFSPGRDEFRTFRIDESCHLGPEPVGAVGRKVVFRAWGQRRDQWRQFGQCRGIGFAEKRLAHGERLRGWREHSNAESSCRSSLGGHIDSLAALMIPTHSGSIRLFRFAGIQVCLHWSWFVVAIFQISSRLGNYSSPLWNVAEYLVLFAIVLLHEFGHALACRQTGGRAEEIVLWPLGGIAFVSPPMRPGAVLWSIAAGPLVNVVLVPVFFGLLALGATLGWSETQPDLARFLVSVGFINGILLIFNLLPVYPLDGGQILQSLLWFWLGRARSLYVSAVIGLVGVAAFVGYAIWRQSLWTGILALFLGQRCLESLRHARGLAALGRVPRHVGFKCPSCGEPPPGGPMWRCGRCGNAFNPFATDAVCPHCTARQNLTPCAYCGSEAPIERWQNRPGRAVNSPIIDV